MKLSLKNVFLSVGMLAFALGVFGLVSTSKAEAYARTASVSGAWGDTATWGGNSVPVAGDTVTINAAVTVNIDATAAATSITFIDPAAGAGNGITFTGTNTLTVSGAITVPLSSGVGTTTIAVGTGTLSAGSVSITGGASGIGSMTVGDGNITTTGDFSLLGASAITKALLTSTDAGSVISIGGNFVNTLGTVTNLGIMTITGNLTGGGTVVNGANAGLYLNGTTNTVTTLTATAAGNSVFYGGGDQTIIDTATHTYYNLYLQGTGTKTITGLTTITGGLVIGGTATVTTAANITIAATLGVQSGATLHLAGYSFEVGTTSSITGTVDTTSATGTKTFTGLVTVNSGGSFSLAALDPVNVFGAGITNNSATAVNLGAGGTTLTGNLAGTGNITFEGALTIASGTTTNSNTGTVTVTGTLTLTGAWTQAAGSSLTLLATTATDGAGVLTTTLANTVTYGGGAQTVLLPAAGYYNLTLSGTLAKSFPASTIINQTLTVNSGTTITLLTSSLSTANKLYFGTAYQKRGTWGATAATATNETDTYFTSGITYHMTVAVGRATVDSGTGGTGTINCISPAVLTNGVCKAPNTTSEVAQSPVPITVEVAPGITETTMSPGCSGGNKYNTSTGALCQNTIVAIAKATYDFGTKTLKNGSKGAAVMELQRFLNDKLNLGLILDGKLGPKTIAVIKKWQKAQGLVVDGLVGPKTKAMMNAQ
ncbi:MAG: peptidoglycan-binding domain-containing protein [Candidatus Paceibacterota bacterium]